MITIKNGDTRTVKLKIWKGKYRLEDFTRSLVKVWLLNDADAIPVTITLEDGIPVFTMPANLEVGTYAVKVVWVKNDQEPWSSLLDSRVAMMADSDCFVCISNYDDECTPMDTDYVIVVDMDSKSYGYDGLSAYEIAVLTGQTALSQKNWIANLTDMNNFLKGKVNMEVVDLSIGTDGHLYGDVDFIIEN